MCFSASASFSAGIVLSAIGVATIKKVQSPEQYFFASIPLIFSFQQISEGVLWLALSDSGYAPLESITTYTFLFLAQVAWPFWVPFSILMFEKEENRKKTLRLFLAIGALVSSMLAFYLATYQVQGKIIEHHIFYTLNYPIALRPYGRVFYIIATVFPPFFSSSKKMWSVGSGILISYIISALFYTNYIISVWCFFASIISVLVYVVLREIKPAYKKPVVQPV